ncbi:DMT family transporter [Bacillus suaedaesalsae]|uniref:DMT family transporter n=1 Tax=Bacillus suaedaesalsae TaxID=2810349 RepID=A0ABS2DIB9_9BACI|nr:DMT family transporter [Bacillus suaedaesalsae]MBM6618136.1 DMT family transporter [Bacillus suaedaesalsae]
MKIKMIAVLTAVVVTMLWSSSYFLNVYAFKEGVGPLTLAGLRYTIAAFVLFLLSISHKGETKHREKITWKYIFLLGISGYLVAQGFQYWGQFFITPTQTSLLLNIGNTTIVAVLASILINEKIKKLTIVGMIGVIVGAGLYYFPWEFNLQDTIGISLVVFSSIGYGIHIILIRFILKKHSIKPTELVMKPMVIGAIGMLCMGIFIEALPHFSWNLVFIVLWLGIVNGSIAFTLWTWSQKYLEAFESSIINNLMLVEIAIFDMLLLNRNFTLLQFTGSVIVTSTILIVQLIPHLKKEL